MQLESSTVEALTVTFRANSDPTGDTVEFALTAATVSDPSGWSAGSWGTYASGSVTATTPTIGASATLPITEGSSYLLWARIDGAVVLRVTHITAI